MTLSTESSRALYYAANRQVMDERTSGVVVVRNVWSPGYDRSARSYADRIDRLYMIDPREALLTGSI
ncbi:MAG: hypothetical protein ACRCZF_21365, partial [Gemmataceae bacterium]